MSRLISLEDYGGSVYSLEEYARAVSSDNRSEMVYLKQVMLKAIGWELNKKQADILKRYYFGGESISDLALNLGVNKSTVSRSVKRSTEKLRQALKYASYALSLARGETPPH